VKYLIYLKRFIVESNIWKKKEDLNNTKEAIANFEERIGAKVRKQEKLDLIEEQDFKREELLKKYIIKMLYIIMKNKY